MQKKNKMRFPRAILCCLVLLLILYCIESRRDRYRRGRKGGNRYGISR